MTLKAQFAHLIGVQLLLSVAEFERLYIRNNNTNYMYVPE